MLHVTMFSSLIVASFSTPTCYINGISVGRVEKLGQQNLQHYVEIK
jgi:hypothetical protein